MYKEDCGCNAKGRLFIHVESKCVDKVKIEVIEANMYKDVYEVVLKEGIGRFKVDRIGMGELKIFSDIDGEGVLYYPGNTIVFDRNHYVHKLVIVDRRKRNAM